MADRQMATTPAVQPSPGGQGDALVEAAMIIANAAHDRALMSDILSGMRAHEAQSLKSAILALDAALAAREPVYVQGCDELRARTEGERAAYMEGLEEGKKIAARQPVGEHPVAVSITPEMRAAFRRAYREGGFWADRLDTALDAMMRAAPPAQAVDLDSARREGHDCAIRYVLGYLNGTGDLASTQYGEILNGCGRESIIRSAIMDGELEFTGLGRWVAKYGTDAERALIGSQAVAP